MKQVIETSKTIDQVFEDFKTIGFENLGAKPFCSTYVYLDNGEGRSTFVSGSIEVKEGKIIVSLLKSEIPYYWRWQADEIFEELVSKVEGAVED